MKKTSLLTLLMASSFVALNVYAMNPDENNRDPAGHVRGLLPIEDNEENQYHFTITEDIVFPAAGNPRATFLVRSPRGQEIVERDIELLELAHMRYESQLYAGLDLNPNHPLPEVLGTARERARCTFNYAGRRWIRQLLLPTEYPLRGQWGPIREDRDHHQNVRSLQLTASRGDQPINVFQQRPIQALTPHELVEVQGERIGDNYFDGYNVRRERRIPQLWRNLRNNEPYRIDLVTRVCNLRNHEDNEIVYVEPFAFERNRLLPREEYRGNYSFRRDLTPEERLKGREPNRLIYSDGTDIYLPHITQELWRREGAHVCFFIASYRRERRLNFIRQATLPEDRFPEGLYALHSVENRGNRQCERWRRLGDDLQEIEVGSPAGVSSIPGMGGSVPRLPQTQAGSAVFKLMNTIQRLTEIVRQNANHPGAQESVFILGPAGSGKSTLIHHLNGPLDAQPHHIRGLILQPRQVFPGFNIGHDIVNVGTRLPCFYFDRVHNRVFGDTPGFGDPGGAETDIINAFLRHEILKGNFKIVLAVPEAQLASRTDFIKLLKETTELFPDENTLRENLSLVVTQKMPLSGDTHAKLQDILEGDAAIFTEASRRLLAHLVANPNRIANFPFPTREGPYVEGRAEIARSIEAAHSVRDPRVNIRVDAESQLLLGELGQGLNDYLIKYIKTEGDRMIVNYCLDQIDRHRGSVTELRESFTRLMAALRNIPTDSRTGFVALLRNYIGVEEIDRTINHIGFLKNIGNGITYQTAAWANALNHTIEKIRALTAAPQELVEGGILKVNGVFVGTSDIQQAINRHPGLPVQIFALNEVFFDGNVANHSLNFVTISPKLKVINPITVNLSGVAGGPGGNGALPGANGQPGTPGGNGGNFYGKAFFFEGLPQLTINTNGGAGGNGGNGAAGGSGVLGADGSPATLTGGPIPQTFKVNRITRERGNRYYYQAQGANGTVGQNGGQGGRGGFGGHFGMVHFDGYLRTHTAQDGVPGSAGTPGTGGLGGVHGKHCNLTQVRDVKRMIISPDASCFTGWRSQPNRSMEIIAGHMADRGRASNGQPGQGLNAVNQQTPATQQPLNSVSIVQGFQAHYLGQAIDPSVSPFIKVFPAISAPPQQTRQPQNYAWAAVQPQPVENEVVEIHLGNVAPPVQTQARTLRGQQPLIRAEEINNVRPALRPAPRRAQEGGQIPAARQAQPPVPVVRAPENRPVGRAPIQQGIADMRATLRPTPRRAQEDGQIPAARQAQPPVPVVRAPENRPVGRAPIQQGIADMRATLRPTPRRAQEDGQIPAARQAQPPVPVVRAPENRPVGRAPIQQGIADMRATLRPTPRRAQENGQLPAARPAQPPVPVVGAPVNRPVGRGAPIPQVNANGRATLSAARPTQPPAPAVGAPVNRPVGRGAPIPQQSTAPGRATLPAARPVQPPVPVVGAPVNRPVGRGANPVQMQGGRGQVVSRTTPVATKVVQHQQAPNPRIPVNPPTAAVRGKVLPQLGNVEEKIHRFGG